MTWYTYSSAILHRKYNTAGDRCDIGEYNDYDDIKSMIDDLYCNKHFFINIKYYFYDFYIIVIIIVDEIIKMIS